MQILSRVLGQHPVQLTAISANWALARESSPVGVLPPMFSLLGEQEADATTSGANNGDGSIVQILNAASVDERQSLLESHLQELVARVLQLDQSQFSNQESLTSLGMDSMMAIELKHRIEGSLKVEVSVLELLQGTTVAHLTTSILSSLQSDESSMAADAALSAEDIQALVEQADSEQLERLLAELEQTVDVTPS